MAPLTQMLYPRRVTVEEGEKKAREYNIMFIETSAKAGFNVRLSSIVSSSSCV